MTSEPTPIRPWRVEVFLDVDGVVNALPYGEPEWGWESPPQRERINGYPITWAPDLVERINRWHQHPRMNVRWLTTWCDDARRVLAPILEFDDFEVVGIEEYRQDHTFAVRQEAPDRWWKFRAMVHAYEAYSEQHKQGMVGVWIDDDLRFGGPEVEEWLYQVDHIMMVSPNPQMGLTKDKADKIEKNLTHRYGLEF